MGNPQKLTQLRPRSHPRDHVGKMESTKRHHIDTTSDSQVNSNFPHRWLPASLTFNNYFYQFVYLYTTGISINNNTSHLKSTKTKPEKPPCDGQQRIAFCAPSDDSQGALRLAPVCLSVCPSVRHALRYRVCVINSSNSF